MRTLLLAIAVIAAQLLCIPFAWGAVTIVHTPGNLLVNGSFDSLTNGVPSGWTAGPGVGHEEQYAWHGSALALRISERMQRCETSSQPFTLDPNSRYHFSFYFRALEGGSLRFRFLDARGTEVASYGPTGTPFLHQNWAFVETDFQPQAGLQNPCKLVITNSGGERALVDELELTQADQSHTGVTFTAQGGHQVVARLGLLNHKNESHKVHYQFKLVNYFNEVIKAEEGDVTLAPGDAIDRSYPFTTKDQTVFRGEINAKFDDGYTEHQAEYYECDCTQGMRQQTKLNDYPCQFQLGAASLADLNPDRWEKSNLRRGIAGQDDAERGVNEEKTRYAWFRLLLPTPPLHGASAVLEFTGVRISPVLYVNGAEAGHAYSRAPLSVEITKFLKPAGDNEILVRLDRQNSLIKQNEAGKVYAVTVPGDGGAGIYDDVLLHIVPTTRVERVQITSSFRNKSLTLQYLIHNGTTRNAFITIQPVVYGEGKQSLVLPAKRVYVQGEIEQLVTFQAAWASPHLYFPHDPYLYRLHTKLTADSGVLLDAQNERFGFREIWADGDHLKINGRVFKSYSYQAGANASQGGIPDTRSTIWWVFNNYERNGMYMMRDFVTEPTYRRDVADELGFMLRYSIEVDTPAIVRSVSLEDTPLYWESMREIAKAHLLRDGNHPSIMTWDMENEAWVSGGERYPWLMEHFVDVERYMRGLRPGILIEHDGADPQNASDITCLHYPHSGMRTFAISPVWPPVLFPRNQVDYLNMYPGSIVRTGEKPFGLGEQFWDVGDTPQWFSFLTGDEAYTGGQHSQMMHTVSLDVLSQAYREAEVAYMTTWGGQYLQLASTMQPDAVFFKQYDKHFFAGERVTRTAMVCHDITTNITGRLVWQLTDAHGKAVQGGAQQLDLPSGALRDVDYTLHIPPVTRRSQYTLALTLWNGDTQLASRTMPIDVSPRRAILAPAGLTIQLYDPKGDTARALQAEKIPFTPVHALTTVSLAPGQLLLIGRDALVNVPPPANALRIRQAVADGARVVVLEQRGRVASWWPVEVTDEVGFYAPAGFPRAVNHPLLAGITAQDLKYWRGSALVSAASWCKPFLGNVTPIVDTGGMGGMLSSSLLEIPEGKGSFVLCQLKVTEKLQSEPAARQLLQNLLSYAAKPTFRQANGTLVVMGDQDGRLQAALTQCGIRHRILDPTTVMADSFIDAPAVLVDGRLAPTPALCDALAKAVAAGTRLWLQGITPDTAAQWQPLTGQLTLSEHKTYRFAKKTDDPLFNGLSNTDFYWAEANNFDFYGPNDAKSAGDIIRYDCWPANPRAQRLAEYGAFCRIPLGKGTIILDNTTWAESLTAVPARAPRIPTQLALNFGVAVDDPGYQPVDESQLTYTPISLAGVANEPLTADFPQGLTKFAGVPMEIAKQGALMLGCAQLETPAYAPALQARVNGITVNQHADYLYFLTTLYDPFESGTGFDAGEVVGGFVVHYADGTSQNVNLLQRVHTTHMMEQFGDLPGARMVWQGPTPFVHDLDIYTDRIGQRWPQRDEPNHLYLMRWCNPHPDVPVTAIDCLSANKYYCPILLGLTAATR
jgi:hypothetical protein